MTATDGKIVPDYEVYCAGERCDEYVLGLGRYRNRAAAELRRDYGWQTRGRRWFCPHCIKEAATAPPPQRGTL